MKIIKIVISILLVFTILVGCSKTKDEPVVQLPIEVVEKAEKFVIDLLSERYDKVVEADLDTKMQFVFTEQLAKNIYVELITVCGFFNKVEETIISEDEQYKYVTLICKFDLVHVNMKVTIDDDMKIAGIYYTYNHDYTGEEAIAINESEVTFGFEFEIKGALTIPESDELVPLVIIVGGSGPTDRNGTVGINTPYLDIATSLYERGIATLRFDKRTLTNANYYANNLDGLTLWDECIDDAAIAFYYAQTLSSVDKDRIYIIGHSLGGYAMGRIAVMTKNNAAGYILMAANSSHMEDLIITQLDYLNNIDGVVSEEEQNILNDYTIQRNNIKGLTEDSDLTYEVLMNVPKSYWLDLKDYDPVESVSNITKPVLILQGERDYQVTMEEYQVWYDRLNEKDNITFETFKNLNHLFMTGQGVSIPEEYAYSGTVSREIIDALELFINK